MKNLRMKLCQYMDDFDGCDGFIFGGPANLDDDELFFEALVKISKLKLRNTDTVVVFSNNIYHDTKKIVAVINAFRGTRARLWFAYKDDEAKTGWDYQGVHG